MTARHPGRMPIRVKVTVTTFYAVAKCPACKTFFGAKPNEARAAADYHARTCYALREANMREGWKEVEALIAAEENSKVDALNNRRINALLRTYPAPINRRSGCDAWPIKEQS